MKISDEQWGPSSLIRRAMLEIQVGLWPIRNTVEAMRLSKWWNESEDGEDVLIARLVGHGRVPRGLRRRIALERGDEGLIISPNNEAASPSRDLTM